MNQNLYMRDFIKDNNRRINGILGKLIAAFLILIPAAVIAWQVDVLVLEKSTLIKVCLLIFAASVIPVIVCRYSYNETVNRCVCLTLMEGLVCLVACNDVISLKLSYVIVPLVSLLYADKAIFIHTARNCFFAMLCVFLYKFYQTDHRLHTLRYTYQTSYEEILATVLEYLILMLLMYLLCMKERDMILSGFLLEQREDGSYVTAAVAATPAAETEQAATYNTKGLFLEINQKIQSMIRGKDKVFLLHVDYDLPSVLVGDTEKIRLAMINILSDLLQFTEQGTVTMTVTYEKGILPRRGQNITLVCRIDCSEDLTEDLRYGNAPGFALAKNMIQKLNGIFLDKTAGAEVRQTKFVISFLQTVEDEETIGQIKEKHREEQKELITDSRKKAQNLYYAKQVKALVVDDSPVNCKLVASLLKSYGMQAKTVESGEEAIEELRTRKYDFVILDHMMPVKGGIQTAKEIRQLADPYFELLPLLVMTSNITEESKQIFYDCGFSEVISKPIKEEELRQALAHCMFL